MPKMKESALLPQADIENAGQHRTPTLTPGEQSKRERRKTGRPSKAQMEAEARVRLDMEREEQERIRKASEVTAEQMQPVVSGVLSAVGKLVRGDEPTEKEITMIAEPAAAVSNKYGAMGRWAQEIMLGASLIYVTTQMARRGQEQRAKESAAQKEVDERKKRIEVPEVKDNATSERDLDGLGQQGIGEISTDAIVSAGAST